MKFSLNWSLILLCLVSIIPLLDLFHPGLPITHDSQDHVARIANFYQDLTEGIIIPRWAANLNWGYGHPILMFLYPLPSYIASLFHFLGFTLVDAIKIVFGLTFILSGFTMYIWISSFLNKPAAMLSAALYMFAPYRFVDFYVRGAIGEHVAFVFPPLVFYFLFKLSRKARWIYIVGGSLSLSLLILSHNAITLMFLPLFFLYFTYLFYQSRIKKYFMFSTSCLMLLGFGLSSFFWIPAFFEGKYTLRDIVTAGGYTLRFVNPKDFLYGPWSYGGTGEFTVQLGVVHLFAVIFAIFGAAVFLRNKSNLRILIIGLSLYFFFTLYLMTEQAGFIWKHITTLQKFQFPWRFLSVSVLLTSALGGIALFLIPKKFQQIVSVLILSLILWFNKDYWHANGLLQKPESFYTSIYNSTTDTGESSPIWSIRFMEHRPKKHIEVILGKAGIEEFSRISTKHMYKITTDEKIRLRENTLYFPGWEVMVDGKNVPVEFQDPQNRGLMTFFVGKGEHDVNIVFRETKLRTLANDISILSLFLLLTYGILRKRSLWQNFLSF